MLYRLKVLGSFLDPNILYCQRVGPGSILEKGSDPQHRCTVLCTLYNTHYTVYAIQYVLHILYFKNDKHQLIQMCDDRPARLMLYSYSISGSQW